MAFEMTAQAAKAISAPRMRNPGRTVLLDSDVDHLQLFLAAYTTFTDVDVQGLERLATKLEQGVVLSASEMPREAVRMGTHVWIQDMMTCETHEYVLAFDTEAQAPFTALSILTPLGAALLGTCEGDEITCPMPDGQQTLRIVKVFDTPTTDARDAADRREESAMQILCATDLLPKTDRAIARAGMIADQLRADLTLMHAFHPGHNDDRIGPERALTQLRSRIVRPKWNCATAPDVMARRGAAAPAIAATARELDAGLVVVGPHRRRVVRDSLVGTTLGHLLRTRVSPVLIVRRRADRPYRTVVFGVDLTPVSLRAVQVAEQLLLAASSSRSLVNAYPPPYINATAEFRTGWRQRAAGRLKNHLSRSGIDLSRYDLILEEDRPVGALAAVARRQRADLMVVGTRGHRPVQRILRTSVASKLANSADCDLLVVPEQRSRKPTWIETVANARRSSVDDHRPSRTSVGSNRGTTQHR